MESKKQNKRAKSQQAHKYIEKRLVFARGRRGESEGKIGAEYRNL